MQDIERTVTVGKWNRRRSFRIFGSFVMLEVVIPGCHCMTCFERLVDIVSTLRTKGIKYDILPLKPDGLMVQIDLNGAKDPIKYMADAIDLSITID